MDTLSTAFLTALVQTGRVFNEDERCLIKYFAGLLDVVKREHIEPYFKVDFFRLVAQVSDTEQDMNVLLNEFRDLLAGLHIVKRIENVIVEVHIFDTIIKDDRNHRFVLRVNPDVIHLGDADSSLLDDYIPLF